MSASLSSEEHTNSYYAATRNDLTDYPVLQGEVETEICVIGAGFTGTAAALTMAERGHAVTLLEQHRISWGASGRNGGQLIHGLGGTSRLRPLIGDEAIWKLHYRGNDIIKERIEKYNIECDFKFGYIEVALKPSHMRGLLEDFEEHKQRDLDHHLKLMDKDEVCSVLGTDAFIGGMTNDLNGHLHPLNLCAGEARAAASLGAKIFEQSGVTDIVHGDKVKVITAEGTVIADKVLIAGNAYHHLEQKNLSGLVFPAGSFIIATEPLSDDEVKAINPLDLAVVDLNNVLDYYRMSADNRLLFGGRCNYSGRVPESIQAIMVPRMLKVYPSMEGKRIDYEWGGNIGIVIKRVPLLGRITNNVFYSMGYSGHGVAPTHIAAEVMSDAMEGNDDILRAYEQINHFRIPLGQWFGNQIVALGMLYFRMRDLLW
ncbi:MAG TPA: FAD-binding oxidoreductase [Pseudomonadales bacterium]|jgi:glycine/D-amino acid oxidase-like deaminating enzyme|nr:FAD-dependent oxidoreductase [Gammaproteobacteria bacterium]MDP6026542.1 FAD-binding oxidoreductase [Pseudomonadales bacterium]MDP6317156.1 FAD-binding oxidoreductase [Pseudomonadales bacterium]MDP7314054.1 FAD-binding oxidoreductase [Pseudomonadales bacterium]HJP50026.1 FAD-binding oxidoreductase [Pseudomonadales bacterium]|tara:strand:- start:15899 stop:17182 length:1284 start_codon:yes stop_codon:yes gene_type:complete